MPQLGAPTSLSQLRLLGCINYVILGLFPLCTLPSVCTPPHSARHRRPLHVARSPRRLHATRALCTSPAPRPRTFCTLRAPSARHPRPLRAARACCTSPPPLITYGYESLRHLGPLSIS
ncbi:hypothetical protein GGX14DRAFT_569748 [Mycena pura]|uniref:Uncharacterized protein n=1 Tax=Mycena pura TaxID=153505 RepID=A0AAD6YDM1_9AGAR|nr:hypothetical protein GGX14DRAFT_569748 [Mycena pura]